jgi:nucleoside-diphosphate-sugar epimerase
MKALVTGASGFIGSHIVEALQAKGHQVLALVRPTSDTSHLKQTRAELVIGDVTDRDSLMRACQGVDWIFHTAAVIDNLASWTYYYQVGVQGTGNLVEAAAENRVARFIHFSSIVVYGMTAVGRTCTEDTPFQEHPERWNHYVREKVLSEQLVVAAHRAGKVCATVMRPSIVIGPRDRTVIPRLLRLLGSWSGATVGEGNNRVPLVVVEELADICVKAAHLKEAEGKCYNLSGRRVVTQRDITAMLIEAAKVREPIIKLPLGMAITTAAVLENIYKLVGLKGEPIATRIGIALGAANWEIDCSRAHKDLGWLGDSDYKSAITRYLKTASRA